jgi:Flp pilus assembly CpaF family ATPase
MRFRAVRKEYANLPVFADIGAGAMRSLGIALAMAQVEVRHPPASGERRQGYQTRSSIPESDSPNDARFSAAVDSDGVMFSIRLHWRAVRPLEDFIAAPRQLAVIEDAIRRGFKLVAIGASGAEKTTFLNGLIAYLLKVSPHERLNIIEDEPELQTSAPNAIRPVVRGKPDMRRHVREIPRMGPDRTIVGEVRGAAALDLLRVF